MSDWLEDQSVDARAQIKEKAVEFAQNYKIFQDDARGRAILEQWVESIEQRDVPPAASLQEYVHWESRRAFVRAIQRQIKMANTEGN